MVEARLLSERFTFLTNSQRIALTHTENPNASKLKTMGQFNSTRVDSSVFVDANPTFLMTLIMPVGLVVLVGGGGPGSSSFRVGFVRWVYRPDLRNTTYVIDIDHVLLETSRA